MPYLRAFREAEVSAEAGSPIRFIASSVRNNARDDFEINHDRWQLENYLRNPVFLWAHNYGWDGMLPIGRGSPEVTERGLELLVDFDQEDEFARAVEGKYRRQFLNAVSVGWDDVKIDGEVWHDLWEVSAVPVPADPDALADDQRAAMRRLSRDLARVADGDVLTPDMDSWGEVAAAMVGIFSRDSDDSDAERRRRYSALLPKYRLLGKEPPAFLTLAEIRALTDADMRGLFLEGETTRAGAVLSRANLERVQQIRKLADELLEAAASEAEDDKGDSEGERAAPDPEPEEPSTRTADPLTSLSDLLGVVNHA